MSADVPGSGAAGGLGAGLMAFASGTLRPGISLVIDAVGLADRLRGADLCLTAEGAIDGSSAFGKTAVGVARLARSMGCPTLAIAGSIGPGAEDVILEGIDAYFSLCPGPISLEEAMTGASELLERAAEQATRAFLVGHREGLDLRRKSHDEQPGAMHLYISNLATGLAGRLLLNWCSRLRSLPLCLGFRHLSRWTFRGLGGVRRAVRIGESSWVSLSVDWSLWRHRPEIRRPDHAPRGWVGLVSMIALGLRPRRMTFVDIRRAAGIGPGASPMAGE